MFQLPLGKLVAVAGVSGSGKSTLGRRYSRKGPSQVFLESEGYSRGARENKGP